MLFVIFCCSHHIHLTSSHIITHHHTSANITLRVIVTPSHAMNSFEIDLLEPLLCEARNPKEREFAPLQAQGMIEWLSLHHFPSKMRKSKLPIEVSSPLRGKMCIQLQCSATSIEHGINNEMWEKGVQSALKRITVEDLGNMNASELETSIPIEDAEGRGMADLFLLEKKLAVKVVFDKETGHVLIVGDQKKLEKKVFVIRNMISHYHWRLSGTDVAFKNATSTKK